GHAVCIEAARQVPEAQFLLVGDGELRPQLEQQAHDLKDRVHFLGQRLDIPDILQASDIFILPSEMEALPTVLIEAGAVGLPCIASDVGGIPEIIQDGKTGLLVPPHDATALANALRKLIQQPEKMRQMGQQALETVREQFDLLHQVRATMNLYERLIQ
ncbi:MAG: glycosyltransferase, partial [Anaerolineae bacterium]|nr:glycosyltransferase [Anaerolineae bacterium]